MSVWVWFIEQEEHGTDLFVYQMTAYKTVLISKSRGWVEMKDFCKCQYFTAVI